MPRTVARSGTAARRSDQLLSFSPKSAERRLVSSAQLRLPSQTNKAVNPIRLSSAGVQTHMNHNDRDTLYEMRISASTLFFYHRKINFSTHCGKLLLLFSSSAPPRPAWILAEVCTVNND